jgi:hypothetical protein
VSRSTRTIPYLVGAVAVAAVLVGLGVPAGAVVPLAIVSVCPLMMLFMMRGMAGGHGDGHTARGSRTSSDAARQQRHDVPS